MHKLFFLMALMLFTAAPASAHKYRMTEYYPMSFADCIAKRRSLGLKFCWGDGDYLAGAAEACGGIKNLPTGEELLELAKSVYENIDIEPNGTTLHGERDDEKMKKLGIWVNDSHIFYWSNEEAHDVNGGYVRMFAAKGSVPYYVPRDGKGYGPDRASNKISFGNTINIRPVKVIVENKTEAEKKHEKEINMNEDEDNEENNDLKIRTEPDDERDSNLSGLPNNDALVTICIKRKK